MYTSRRIKIRAIVFVALAALILTACKKEKAAEPTPTPEPEPPVLPASISVKVNGVEKKCSACYSGSSSGGSRSSYFYLDGFNEQIYLGGFTFPKPGTYSLVKNKEPFLLYIKNNVYYRPVSGTLNITVIDTSAKGVVNKLVGSFNFLTDTTSGVSFNISDGAFNLQ